MTRWEKERGEGVNVELHKGVAVTGSEGEFHQLFVEFDHAKGEEAGGGNPEKIETIGHVATRGKSTVRLQKKLGRRSRSGGESRAVMGRSGESKRRNTWGVKPG